MYACLPELRFFALYPAVMFCFVASPYPAVAPMGYGMMSRRAVERGIIRQTRRHFGKNSLFREISENIFPFFKKFSTGPDREK